MAKVQRWSSWVPFGCVLAFGCAEIVGLTGDYSEGSSNGGDAGRAGGAAGAAGDSVDTGGTQGGTVTGGRRGTNGGSGTTGGRSGDSGSAGAGTGGEEAGGTGGAAGGGVGGDAGSGGGEVLPPSCRGGVRTCGPEGTSNCCASHLVPGGAFDRSNDPMYPATVSAFVLDDYEVTVARFRKFEARFDDYRPSPGDGRNPHNQDDTGWDDAWNAELPADRTALRAELACNPGLHTWTDNPGVHEHRPVTCISWYVATAFCIWDGGRLPTEAEWNFAAAGGDEQRVYPWSDPPESELIAPFHASYNLNNDLGCIGDEMPACDVNDFIRPGSRPAGNGPFGQSDLSGNVFEWVQDSHADYANPCSDCANLSTGTDGVIRGGCYINHAGLLLTEYRNPWPRAGTSPEGLAIGIRCAHDP